jgi:acyl-CoA synthetase (AMP-forming)/AMP-acid ligase II/acyl carrier protein
VESSLPTVFHWLRDRAQRFPNRAAFTFLGDDGTETVTFGELETSAQAIAAHLRERLPARSRALLLYPPGLDFIRAFFGCFAADIIPVPAYPPDPGRLNRTLPRVLAIVNDSGANAALTTQLIAGLSEGLAEHTPSLKSLAWVSTDAIPADAAKAWQMPELRPHAIAFLQYTSGSTGTPRGVAVTHGNLLANTHLICHKFKMHSESTIVGWLPLYHDMGLVGHVNATLVAGGHSNLMSPFTFLQRPFKWLEAISSLKATVSGAPNFAYDLCVRKTTPEQRETLDLSAWEVAYNGAEPIRYETIERFIETFAPRGFRRTSFVPCYGLAEATLMATSVQCQTTGAVYIEVDPSALRDGKIKEVARGTGQVLVGSGTSSEEGKIVIADAEKLRRARPGQIGEIWIHSPYVTSGYWNRSEETEDSFRARLADTGEGPFLRTGDLGFLHQGELFVTGRSKDLIIVHGQNYYPQDIERLAEGIGRGVRPGCSAAFAVEGQDGEHLVIVFEVDPDKAGDLGALAEEISQQIAGTFALQPAAVVMIAPKSIPKTSSGKIQRRATKQGWLTGELEIVHEKKRADFVPRTKPVDLPPPPPNAPRPDPAKAAATARPSAGERPKIKNAHSVDEIQEFIIDKVAIALQRDRSKLDLDMSFADLGLQSVDEVEISAHLEDWLGTRLSPTLTWDYPSIRLLSRYLAGEPVKPASAPKEE